MLCALSIYPVLDTIYDISHFFPPLFLRVCAWRGRAAVPWPCATCAAMNVMALVLVRPLGVPVCPVCAARACATLCEPFFSRVGRPFLVEGAYMRHVSHMFRVHFNLTSELRRPAQWRLVRLGAFGGFPCHTQSTAPTHCTLWMPDMMSIVYDRAHWSSAIGSHNPAPPADVGMLAPWCAADCRLHHSL